MGATLLAPGQQAISRLHREFMCVPLAVFRLQRTSNIDLYCLTEGSSQPTLYRSSDLAIRQEDIEALKSRGHRALYVRTAQYSDLDRQLNASLHDLLDDEETSVEERLAVLQAAAALEVDVAFSMLQCDRFVALTQRIAKQITGLLQGRVVDPRMLFNFVQHDFYTFTHITNVASFATLLADYAGISSPTEREQITVGALLHDIGKRFIPSSVLCKNGRPTDEEWDLIRIHPQRGYEDLCEREDLTFGQLMMVYSHHERPDGKGYPVGLTDEEIHPWAKLVAVVDVFDAITSARPYRSPMKLIEALDYLRRNAGTQFDAEMVQCWTSAMKQN